MNAGTGVAMLAVAALLPLSLLACRGEPPAPPPPRVTLEPCPVPDVEGAGRCGSVEVLEDRSAPNGRRLGLRVLVLPAADSGTGGAPIFVLVGGPGQSAVENAARYAELLAPMRGARDIVFVDQRGTGGSHPLPCDLYANEPAGVLGNFLPLAAVRACRDSLERDADLRLYTSDIAASDLEDVRRALGYEQIDIEAASYGTRVALLYLGRYGEHARAAVLRSPSPPWALSVMHLAEDAQAAFDSLANACAITVACRAAFPDVQNDLQVVVGQLAAAPARVAQPGPGTRADTIVLTRGAFAEKLRLMLYAPDVSRYVPLLIHRAAAGDFEPFVELATDIGQVIAHVGSNGMYLSVTCVEDVAPIPASQRDLSWPGTFLGDYRLRQQTAACALWPVKKLAESFAMPVRSSVPVLVISSADDPITPPRYGEEVVRTLSRGRHLILPTSGHSPANACVMDIVRQFLRSAQPDGLDVTCVTALARPAFALTLDG